MATEVANKVKAKCLILNHFSQRYKPINYVKEEKVVAADCNNDDEIEDNVQKLLDEAKLSFSENVLAAYDLFSYKI